MNLPQMIVAEMHIEKINLKHFNQQSGTAYLLNVELLYKTA